MNHHDNNVFRFPGQRTERPEIPEGAADAVRIPVKMAVCSLSNESLRVPVDPNADDACVEDAILAAVLDALALPDGDPRKAMGETFAAQAIDLMRSNGKLSPEDFASLAGSTDAERFLEWHRRNVAREASVA